MIHLPRLFVSFANALRGIKVVFESEQSFRIQSSIAVLVVLLAAWFRVRPTEWIVLLLLIGSVLILELMNSVLERMVDALKPRIHPVVRDVKDMMAAVVLASSLFAAVIGATIFWPYLARLF